MFPKRTEGFFTTGVVVGHRLVWEEEHFARLTTHAAHFDVFFDRKFVETELRTRSQNNAGPCRCRISYSFVSNQWGVTLEPMPRTKIPVKCRVIKVKEPLGCWKTFPRPVFDLFPGEEVILVDAHSNRVYEGSYTNVFVENKGVFFTPPVDGTILEGICRCKFLLLLRNLGYSVREEPFDMSLLKEGKIFLTNALRGTMEGFLL